MKESAQTERENAQKHLTNLNANNETFFESSNINIDIHSSLMATKKALDEDMKNLNITNVDNLNVRKLSQLFDLSSLQAENILKNNNNSVERSIESLLLNFFEYDISKQKYLV